MNCVTIDKSYLLSQKDAFFESVFPLYLNDYSIVSASLFIRMMKNESFKNELTVDKTFEENIYQIQKFFLSWFPIFSPVQLCIKNRVDSSTKSDRVATFFTGGVDSFYTLLNAPEKITDIIYVHGFDVPLKKTALYNKVHEQISYIAKQLNLNPIFIKTNLRSCISPLNWGSHAHGACLATVGHLLSKNFSKIYIPASFHESDLFPWGSHPDIDPRWSNESISFIHHGTDQSRIGKAQNIIQHPVVRKTLRVCFLNDKNSYNCCNCEKCIRTMISAEAFGMLEEMETFPEKLTEKK